MDSGQDDITAVLEMRKEVHALFGGRTSRRQTLSFETEHATGYGGSSTNPVSMQQLLDKERREKEKQVELVEAKMMVNKFSSELSSLQTKHKQTCIQHEKQIADMMLKHETDRQALTTKKEQLSALLGKDEETRTQLSEVRSELTKTTAKYEQRIRDLQKDKLKLESNIQELEQQSYSKQQELRNNILRLESELNISKLDLTGVTEQLQHTLKRSTTLSNQLEEAEDCRLQAIKAEQRIKQLEQELSSYDGDRTVTRTMKDQLERLNSLESENRKLKSENAYCKATQDNAFLLREEMDGLKKKLQRAEKECADVVNLELENKELKRQLEKWENIQDGSSRTLSATELTRRMTDLQHESTSLLERQGLLQSTIHSLEAKLKSAEKLLDIEQVKSTKAETQVREDEQLIQRFKRKLLLVSKERDSYKGIIDSYDRELKIDSASPQRKNIQQLQEALQGYQRHIISLETELEQKAQELAQTIASSQVLQSELHQRKQMQPSCEVADNKVIVQLREQVASMEKKIEEIQVEKEDLQLRLDRAHMQGVYEPENTKVLTMVVNPFTLARKRRREEIEKVMEDNKRLKTRIEVIEENQGDLEDVTQHVSQKLQDSGVDAEQIKEFQEKIRCAELKNKRLMEVFKQKSNELREVVYRLLGYMIQIPCENQYKLRSMYADSPEDLLLFQQGERGDLQLLETPYSTTLTDQIETYLDQANSIPAFLCSLTMELFSRQTMLP